MDRRLVATAFILASLATVGGSARAQTAGYPTHEEYTERALRAESAPLFQSYEPLRMTLRTDIEFLRDKRDDSTEVEGTVTFVDLDGSEGTKPVQVRTRGNFRRDKRNCNFPPLRLNFPRRQMEGTVFDGQDKLKLVTPCFDNRDAYQRYVLDEYLAYRVLNVLTPYSYRVRAVQVTYEDVQHDYDPRTKIGFLIEADEAMAERNRATYVEAPVLPPRTADGTQSVLVAMFNYMIGNLDWSPVYLHNVEVVRTEDGRYIPVPYDFDFSGLVDARYATPPAELAGRVRNVRQRLFRGFCRAELDYDRVAALFNPHRQQIDDLFTGFSLYQDENDAKDALQYLDGFWKVIDERADFEHEILRQCRDLPG